MFTNSDNLAWQIYAELVQAARMTFNNPQDGTGGQTLLVGTPGNDFLVGASNNEVIGGGGNNLLLGGAGNQLLYGSTDPDLPLNPQVQAAGAGTASNFDVFSGGPNDVLVGGPEHDIFAFAAGCGPNKIVNFDFTPGADKIAIQSGTDGVTNFTQLIPHIQDGPKGAVINLGNNDSITLSGVYAAQLRPDEFAFV